MKNKIICVYKITCLINNKIYIGQTIDYKDRIRHHKSKLKRNCNDNKYLQEDYNKYGLNNFTFEILEECKEENLLERETYWINYYGGINNSVIYNMLDMYQMNDEIKQSRQGKNNIMYGKTHSLKTKQLLRDKNKGKQLSKNHKYKISEGLKNSTIHQLANHVRRKASTKYDQIFIDKLKEEYMQESNYTKIANRYNIQPGVVSNLIKYGTTSRVVISKLKN